MLAVAALALVGLPPTAGFMGKLFLLSAAWDRGYDWLVVVAALNTAISIYYYLNLIRHAYTVDPAGESPPAAAPGGAWWGGALAAAAADPGRRARAGVPVGGGGRAAADAALKAFSRWPVARAPVEANGSTGQRANRPETGLEAGDQPGGTDDVSANRIQRLRHVPGALPD